MRLLQLVPLHDSYRVFLAELTEALRGEGHEVRTLCRIGPGNAVEFPKEETDCEHFAFPRGSNPLRHFQAAMALRKVMADFRPHLVHAHFSAAILNAAIARSSRFSGIRFLGTFQGLQYPLSTGSRTAFLRRAEVYAATHMDEAWLLTEDDAEALRRDAPRATIRLQESRGFGCHDRFFDTPRPEAAQRVAMRDKAGLPEDAVIFLFIGRLVAFKGFSLAARAFMQAYERRPELRWLVIGERDPLHPTGLTESEWAAFSHHPGIQWLRTQNDVLPWLDLADAVLFPTSREGMPVSVMEALARRVPVLTNRVRGCRELVDNGVNGHFFRESSVDAIREVLDSFTPFQAPAPPARLRRSNWIAEMRRAYAGCESDTSK